MKYCLKCKTSKDKAEFYAIKARTDGLSPYCRKCYREYLRQWARTDKGRANVSRKSHRMSVKHAAKLLARRQLRYSVARGGTIRPTQCSQCGSPKQIEAHHEDYSKPLDVMWLCQLCHKAHHGKIVDQDLLSLTRRTSYGTE